MDPSRNEAMISSTVLFDGCSFVIESSPDRFDIKLSLDIGNFFSFFTDLNLLGPDQKVKHSENLYTDRW